MDFAALKEQAESALAVSREEEGLFARAASVQVFLLLCAAPSAATILSPPVVFHGDPVEQALVEGKTFSLPFRVLVATTPSSRASVSTRVGSTTRRGSFPTA